jgi:predicted aspartyl protease
VTVLLDTGASHGFICARLAAELGLPASSSPARIR